MSEDKGGKTTNTAAEFLDAAAEARAVAQEPAEEGEEDFAAVGRLGRVR